MERGRSVPCSHPSTKQMGTRLVFLLPPILVELGERIQINGEIMPMTDIERSVRSIQPIAEDMDRMKEGHAPHIFRNHDGCRFFKI